jgi:hypothetical protein
MNRQGARAEPDSEENPLIKRTRRYFSPFNGIIQPLGNPTAIAVQLNFGISAGRAVSPLPKLPRTAICSGIEWFQKWIVAVLNPAGFAIQLQGSGQVFSA